MQIACAQLQIARLAESTFSTRIALSDITLLLSAEAWQRLCKRIKSPYFPHLYKMLVIWSRLDQTDCGATKRGVVVIFSSPNS